MAAPSTVSKRSRDSNKMDTRRLQPHQDRTIAAPAFYDLGQTPTRSMHCFPRSSQTSWQKTQPHFFIHFFFFNASWRHHLQINSCSVLEYKAFRSSLFAACSPPRPAQTEQLWSSTPTPVFDDINSPTHQNHRTKASPSQGLDSTPTQATMHPSRHHQVHQKWERANFRSTTQQQ